jgi:hypothetical protein
LTAGIQVVDENGGVQMFDKCLVGAHAPDALQMLGDEATFDERCILGAFQYSARYIDHCKGVAMNKLSCWLLFSCFSDSQMIIGGYSSLSTK